MHAKYRVKIANALKVLAIFVPYDMLNFASLNKTSNSRYDKERQKISTQLIHRCRNLLYGWKHNASSNLRLFLFCARLRFYL